MQGVARLTCLCSGQGLTTRPASRRLAIPAGHATSRDDFSAEVLIAELAAEIATRVPRGPIRIVGISIGGHFGYAAALQLQAIGREIAGFCVIDTFMIASSEPSAGWKGRHLKQGLELLRKRRIGEFILFVRSLFWRALFRLARGWLPSLLRRFASSGRLPSVSALDPLFERELSMRLLIREVAPWIASLDRDPVALEAPTVLLRTRRTASDDAAWQRRCPGIKVMEIPGDHHNVIRSRKYQFTARDLHRRNR